MNGKSYFPLVMVGVEGSIRHDDVIHEENAHNLARLGDLDGQQVVVFARGGTATRMIVADGENGGIVKNNFLYYHPNINSAVCHSTNRHSHFLDELEILVHK